MNKNNTGLFQLERRIGLQREKLRLSLATDALTAKIEKAKNKDPLSPTDNFAIPLDKPNQSFSSLETYSYDSISCSIILSKLYEMKPNLAPSSVPSRENDQLKIESP